jgi:ABC-type dipeptide/oligopeptide/nickel transport system ATPase component/ABC-type dipeptide/oligopeptide/nickel transport system permease subunit
MTTTPLEIDVDPTARRRGLLQETLRSPIALGSAIVLALVVLAALLAPLIAPYDPSASDLSDVFAPMSAEHLLGADSAGRDLFSRLLYGARLSLGGAGVAVAVALLLGVPSGLLAGYYGGAFDVALSWLSNLLIALPGIVVLLALRPLTGPSVWTSMVVFGVLLAPSFSILVRSTVANVRKELYVDAAKVSGLGDVRIIRRHVLGVVRAPIVIQTAMILAIALFIQAGLDFLGFGDLTAPSWGGMLNDGFANIFRGPHLLVWPGIALGVTCAALALLANSLRDVMEGSAGAAPVGRRRKAAARPAVDGFAADDSAEDVPAPSPSSLLDVRGLRVSYSTHGQESKEVVHGASLRVEPGEVVGIVGESGSGKTQIALSIMGLLPEGGELTDGELTFGGRPLDPRSAHRLLGRSIAYIPQEPLTNLDPAFTIGRQLVEPLRVVNRLSAAAARERALELLARVGIPEPRRVFDSYPHQISGGMAQRVLIAGAIAGDPELIIADEPTTALDVTVQADILDVLRDLQGERGLAILLVTHNFGVIADLCERVYVMRQGRVVETATTRVLHDAPREEYTRMLLSHILEGGPSRTALDAQAAQEVSA